MSRPPSIPGLDVRATDLCHSTACLNAGVFSYRQEEKPKRTGLGWLWRIADASVRSHLYDVIDERKQNWRETWIVYASPNPAFSEATTPAAMPSVIQDRITVVDHLDRATPNITLFVPVPPAFTWRSFWLWEFSLKDGVDIAFPLWPPLAIVTLIWGRGWYVNTCKSRRISRGDCAQCGYQRSGLSSNAACPECGARQPAQV